MKIKKSVLSVVAVSIVLAAGLIYIVAYSFAHKDKAVTSTESAHSEKTTDCKTKGKAYTVRIKNALSTPEHTTAKLCDTLTIANDDTQTREIGFGSHEQHTAYDGITEQVLKQGESLTVTLNKAGSYHFHDHIHDDADGYFTVQ